MGICYSEEEEWEIDQNYARKRKARKKKKTSNSIIYEEKTVYEESFTSAVHNSFREDLHHTLNHIASSESSESIVFGSVNQMGEKELESLSKSLEQINSNGQDFNCNQCFTLCNLKTKNFLHTHKIRHPECNRVNEVSACPYTSGHILDYDLWKLIEIGDKYYIYHPFTQKFLSIHKSNAVCSDQKFKWKIVDYGRRRNGGFIKIVGEFNDQVFQLCMTDKQSLLTNHRQLTLCKGSHISHLWEIHFGEYIVS